MRRCSLADLTSSLPRRLDRRKDIGPPPVSIMYEPYIRSHPACSAEGDGHVPFGRTAGQERIGRSTSSRLRARADIYSISPCKPVPKQSTHAPSSIGSSTRRWTRSTRSGLDAMSLGRQSG